MIREATINDVALCGEMASAFYFKHNSSGFFVAEQFIAFWEMMLAKNLGTIYLRERSGVPVEAMGIIRHPSIYNGLPSAASMFWYTTNGQGLASGSLFDHVMTLLRAEKIAEFKVPILIDDRLGKVAGFLLNIGFVPSDMTYEIKLN